MVKGCGALRAIPTPVDGLRVFVYDTGLTYQYDASAADPDKRWREIDPMGHALRMPGAGSRPDNRTTDISESSTVTNNQPLQPRGKA